MSFSRAFSGLWVLGLTVSMATPAPALGADVIMNGYYRTRARAYSNLFLQKDVVGDVAGGDPSSDEPRFYFDHRLRLEPEIRINPYLSIYAQADVFDNRVWGSDPTAQPFSDLYTDSAGVSQTLGLSQNYGSNIAVKRAWAEVYTPVGRVKMGRTANSAGMGIYYNDGNGWDADTGDTVDRVQFLTRVGPLYGLIGVDQIFEGLPDYGYDGQALVAALAYRSELSSAALYSYWQRDRSYPYVPGSTIETTEAGGNVFSDAVRNDMLIGTWSLWTRTDLGPVMVEAEGVLRYGKGNLALLPEGAESADQAVSLASVTYLQGGASIRSTYKRDIETWGVEVGFASGDEQDGDDEVTDLKFTTFSFDPNYRVSLLMFRVPMPQSASTYNETGLTAGDNQVATGYSISNAIYVRPNVTANIMDGLSVSGAALAGWSFVPNPATNGEKLYGYEFMGTVKYSLWDRMDLRARGSIMLPGPAYADADREIAHSQPAMAGEIQAFISF